MAESNYILRYLPLFYEDLEKAVIYGIGNSSAYSSSRSESRKRALLVFLHSRKAHESTGSE